ncbi:MAG TPA: PAS domain S-box protein [Bacteroidales bacterium]|nr:PAS domain S-box protein [Bacteroidales bacterium]
MKSALDEKLKSLSKDQESFEQLKLLFAELNKQKNRAEKHLHLLERVTENDYDSILITELQLEKPGPKIVYVNQGFTKITGYEVDEVIGKTPRILQGPKTDRATLNRLKERLKNGRPFFGQTVNYRKDGSAFINQWDIHPLRNEKGEITHWVSYQHDITERKRAEKMIVNTHAEFDEMEQASKSTLLDVDTEGTILAANKSFRNLTGYAKDELIGKKIWEFFPRKYRNSLKTRFDKKFEARDFNNQKLMGIIKHKEGLPIQVEGKSSVLTLKEKTIIRTEINNISLQKRIMETLEKRNKDYENIIGQATEFSYRVSMKNDDLILDYVSEAFSRITGLPREKVTNEEGLKLFVHQEDIVRFKSCLKNVINGKSCTCEYRIKLADGSYQRVLDYCKSGTCKNNGSRKCVRGAVTLVSNETLDKNEIHSENL